MFEAKDRSGNVRTVYAVDRDHFLVDENEDFVWQDKDEFSPIRKLKVEAATKPEVSGDDEAVLSYTQKKVITLKDYIEGLQNGQIRLSVGDSVTVRLKDGTEVDFVVTDLDDAAYRFESRDCLGRYVPMTKIDEFYKEVWDLLPDVLRDSIVDTVRFYKTHNGKLQKRTCKLFLPSASEIFPPEDCYGDKEVYQQMDWYKDAHNRIRAIKKGNGTGEWYWTQSAYSGHSSRWCSVSSSGSAIYNNASNTSVAAPVCFRIPRS